MATPNDTSDTVIILLSKGYQAIIDVIDADLTAYNWNPLIAKNHIYVQRKITDPDGRKSIYLHRIILSRMLGRELEWYERVDHKDLNPLNNRRDNLRLATFSQNAMNKGKHSNNKSGCKGVYWHKKNKKWCASIMAEGKRTNLGCYQDIEDARTAYREAAIAQHREFAPVE